MPPQRRSKKDTKAEPPRPANPWILYRQAKWKEMQENGYQGPQSNVSQVLSKMWANEPAEIRSQYEMRAALAKAAHVAKYPDYVYRPQQKNNKKDGSPRNAPRKGSGTSAPGSSATNPIVVIPLTIYPAGVAEYAAMPTELFGAMGPSPPASIASSPDTSCCVLPTVANSAPPTLFPTPAISPDELAHQYARIASACSTGASMATPASTGSLVESRDSPASDEPCPQHEQSFVQGRGPVEQVDQLVPDYQSEYQTPWLGFDQLFKPLDDMDFFTPDLLTNPDVFQVTSSEIVEDGPMDVTLVSSSNDEFGWLSMQSLATPGASSSSVTLDAGYHYQNSLDWMHPQLHTDSLFPGYSPYETNDPTGMTNEFAFPNMDSIPMPEIDLQPDVGLAAVRDYANPCSRAVSASSIASALDIQPTYNQNSGSRGLSPLSFQTAQTEIRQQSPSPPEGRIVSSSNTGLCMDKLQQFESNPGSRVSSISSSASHASLVAEAKIDLPMHASSSVYQPPPGAMHSTTRRVGGSWNNLPLDSGSK
jgi:hypothetical protein